MDEIKMLSKHGLRCIDLVLRYLMACSVPFGGKITILLILAASNVIICSPIVDEWISRDRSIVSAANEERVPRMQINDGTSPILQAGIAHVNGRFGKSIRAFTVNEFEKYIGGLV